MIRSLGGLGLEPGGVAFARAGAERERARARGAWPELLRRLMRDSRGVTMLEYLVLAGLIALAGMAAVRVLGAAIDGTTQTLARRLSGAPAHAVPPSALPNVASPPGRAAVTLPAPVAGSPGPAYAAVTLPARRSSVPNPIAYGWGKISEWVGDAVSWPFETASDLSREGAIRAGDDVKGNDLIDTDFEKKLLRHWVRGEGDTYRLSPAEFAAVRAHPRSRAVGDFIRGRGSALAEGRYEIGGSPSHLWPVTFADGSRGYGAVVDYNLLDDTARGDLLDGSLGRAKAFYDESGNLVGIVDSYDFSNENLSVKLVNLAGAADVSGARNFVVAGGVMGRALDSADPGGTPRPEDLVEVPKDPDFTDSAGDLTKYLVREGLIKVEEKRRQLEEGLDPIF